MKITARAEPRPPINEKGHSWLHPALGKRNDAARGGLGIFAMQRVKRDTLLAILGGHVMRLQEEPVFPDGRGELQRRYTGYFQWYLQEKINGLTPSPRRAQRTTT